MLARTLSENRNGSSNTTPTWVRSDARVTSRTLVPSIVTAPADTS
jgi:hypothetical protein